MRLLFAFHEIAMQRRTNESFGAQTGQVFLIVVLIMFIGLTVGLSVASRSVINLKSSLEEENSQRAFAAAEAGVEKALKGLAVTPGQFGELNTSIKSVSIDDIIPSTSMQLNGGAIVEKDDGADIWLTNNPSRPLFGSKWPGSGATGTITIYWGDASVTYTCLTTPGLEVIVLSDVSGTVASKRYVFDPCNTRGTMAPPVSVNSGSYSVAGKTYKFNTGALSITDGYIVRAIPLYAGSYIGVTVSSALPLQGKTISAVGTSGSTSRKVTYYQGHPKIPNEIFQYILFQPN